MGTIIAELGQRKNSLDKLLGTLTAAAGALVDSRAFIIRRLPADVEALDTLADIDAALVELQELGMEV